MNLAWAYAIERSSRESRTSLDLRFDLLEARIDESTRAIVLAIQRASLDIADACTVAILKTEGRLQ